MTDRRQLLQESLAAIERLEARLEALEGARREPIAIVGAGCRYPGGIEDLDSMWRVLRDGVDAVTDVPPDRWDVDAYYAPDPQAPDKMVTRRAGFVSGIDRFEPALFGISPREAAALDPQHRLLLETSYEALESAGIAPDRLNGTTTGVFIGITTNDYFHYLREIGSDRNEIYSATGTALNAASGRIAFTWGLMGPCVSVDTACSSSLAAVHLACQSLRAGDSDLALAGGVNVILSPEPMVLFSRWGMMAPDGRCKTFDAAADGFVRAEGCGIVALKRLSDALAGGDPILAVIRGSAVNSDGRSSGLTVPSGPAQQAVVRSALASAGLLPADIDYVEAHGTGTSLGDPIEVEALGAVMREGRAADRPLRIGTIKTNIGHSEAASGVAGLLKTVVSLRHEAIPPHLHFKTPNPRIPWDELPLAVAPALTPWPRGERPRRAGVSAFGFSGTNAHVILEEAPLPPPAPAVQDMATLVPLSAREEGALRELALRTANLLAETPGLSLAAVGHSAGVGRAHLGRRLALVADSKQTLEQDLRAYAGGQLPVGATEHTLRPGQRPKIAFLFTGQGAQYAGMGRGLYETEPAFRAALDRAAAALASRLPRPLLEVIFPAESQETPIHQTGFTQPALFALEWALAELWRSWGITPSFVMGHSVGELAAACVAGAMSLEDGLALIAERGRLMQALPAGGVMAAVFATEERVATRIAPLGGRVSLAALNGPEETVISGDADAVAEVLQALAAEGVTGKALEVSHAFHSHRLDPMLGPLEKFAGTLRLGPPRIPIVSNLTGKLLPAGTTLDGRYFRRHAREPVRFAEGLAALEAAGATALVEIGPHPTLLGLAGRARPGATWLTAPSLRRGRDDRRELLGALGTLHVHGATVDWAAVNPGGPGPRAQLPTYPFQRERHWATPGPGTPAQSAFSPPDAKTTKPAGHPLLGGRQRGPGAGAQFLAEVSLEALPFLAEHVVFDTVLMPGTGYVEMALAAARELAPGDELTIENIVIEAPLGLSAGSVQLVHTALEPEAAGRSEFQVRSAPQDASDQPWRVHARGAIRRSGKAPAGPDLGTVADVRARCATVTDVEAYYERLARAGLTYGPAFKGVKALQTGDREAVGTLEVAARPEDPCDGWVLHPALLDAAFHLLGPALAADRQGELDRVYLPVGVESLRVSGAGVPLRVQAAARLRPSAPNAPVFVADLRMENDAGEEVGAITGLQLRPIELEKLQQSLAGYRVAARTYAARWEEVPAPQPGAGVAAGRYVLVGDEGGVATALAEALESAGARSTVVPAAQLPNLTDDVLAAMLRGENGSALTWLVDCSAIDPANASDPRDAVRAGYLRHLRLARAVSAAAPQGGLCLVTRGAQVVGAGDDPSLAHAPLLGLARTVEAERLGAPALRIDLDPAAPADVRPIVAALCGLHKSEPELGVRGGRLLAPRLEEPAAEKLPPRTREVLRFKERGDLEQLHLVREPRRPPGANEVEIEIRAAGINFRDVLNTLGMIPGAADVLGAECAGIVLAVGAGVTHVRPGDEVVAFAMDSLATHVTAPASLVLPKPPGVGFAAAVTVPNAYLTAALSLIDVARIRPAQKVLVHAAAGGVGMAALKLARRAGAEVIATAGSPEKRALVLAEGASHAFDSRSASFADDVMRVTNGAGVDCVLNSLAGDLIGAGMRVVKRGGCFVEIGKQGLWTPEEAARRAPGVRYAIVDLGKEIDRDPAPVRASFEQILRDMAAGELPALPVRAYPLRDALTAFRVMAAGRHVGKLVLVPPRGAQEVPVRADGTYLVTGGLGGLGLATASWLATRGAGEIVLVGRRGPKPEDEATLAAVRSLGARVSVVACDIGDAEAVRGLWRDVLAARPPLRGIVHAAGVLSDAVLADQDERRFDVVAAAKIDGALELHAASSRDPLDFFAMFSSTSALLGSPGQANYAAANAFLDALASHRQARGLVATSIGWGAWGEVGMAALLSDAHRARWARAGLGLLEPADAFPRLGRVLAGTAPHVAILALDPGRFAAQAGPAVRALLGSRPAAHEPAKPAEDTQAGPLAALKSAASAEDRAALVRAYVHQETARVLGFSASALDVDTPLSALGFDSLMAVQLRNRVESDLALTLPLTEILGGPTVKQLTQSIGVRLSDTVERPTEPATGAPATEEGSI
jgi:acyl transferase domain-containing protein